MKHEGSGQCVLFVYFFFLHVRGCDQKFPDWPPGASTAGGTALCHYVQLYRYIVSQSSEFSSVTLFVASQRVYYYYYYY
jgi:hypothetical protein